MDQIDSASDVRFGSLAALQNFTIPMAAFGRKADINPIHKSVAIDHQMMPCSGLNNMLINFVVRMSRNFPQCRPHPIGLLEEGLGDESGCSY